MVTSSGRVLDNLMSENSTLTLQRLTPLGSGRLSLRTTMVRTTMVGTLILLVETLGLVDSTTQLASTTQVSTTLVSTTLPLRLRWTATRRNRCRC